MYVIKGKELPYCLSLHLRGQYEVHLTLGLGFSVYKWSSLVLLTHIRRTFWCLLTKLSLEICAHFLFLSQVLIILCRASSQDALFLGIDGFLMFCFNQVNMHVIEWHFLYCDFFQIYEKYLCSHYIISWCGFVMKMVLKGSRNSKE